MGSQMNPFFLGKVCTLGMGCLERQLGQLSEVYVCCGQCQEKYQGLPPCEMFLHTLGYAWPTICLWGQEVGRWHGAAPQSKAASWCMDRHNGTREPGTCLPLPGTCETPVQNKWELEWH